MNAPASEAVVLPVIGSTTLRARRDRPVKSHRVSTVAIWVGSAFILLVVVAALLFQLAGGRWFIVQTPSMGQTAPVGTLVLTTPVTVSELHVGDIISFHPPQAPSVTYTHRIVRIAAIGITTRGDINGGPDGWLLKQQNIVGRATAILPAVGWLVKAVPILAIGAVLVMLIAQLFDSITWRSTFRISGFSLVVAIAAFILRPFTGVVVVAEAAAKHGVNATVVSTGLLPIRVQASHGGHVDLVDGMVGHLHFARLSNHSMYSLGATLNLSIAGWILCILVCMIPLIWTLAFGVPIELEEELA